MNTLWVKFDGWANWYEVPDSDYPRREPLTGRSISGRGDVSHSKSLAGVTPSKRIVAIANNTQLEFIRLALVRQRVREAAKCE